MIIANGFIRVAIYDQNGVDQDTGHRVFSKVEEWGDMIPCQWRALSSNNYGGSNGNTMKVAQYEVIVESMPVEKMIQLLDKEGKEVGEFSVISTTDAHLLNRTIILV